MRDPRARRRLVAAAPLPPRPAASPAPRPAMARTKGKPSAPDAGSAPEHTTASVQILGLGLDGTAVSPSVLVVFDRARYLFNAGEGFQARHRAQQPPRSLAHALSPPPPLQRFCVEHGLRLSRLHHVFLTRASVSCAGGLVGSLLTLSEAAAQVQPPGPPAVLQLHGPPRLPLLVASIGTTVTPGRHCELVERVVTCGVATHADGYLTVTPILLRARDQPADAAPPAKRPRAAAVAPAAGPGGDEAVCYLLELSSVAGKFDPASALRQGVPAGPLFGQLSRGERVAVPGSSPVRWVEPASCCAPAQPGPCVLIVDVPTPQHLAHSGAAVTAACARVGARLSLVVHLTPGPLAGGGAYAGWAQTLGGAHTTHLAANADAARRPAVFRAAATLAHRLWSVHPGLFPCAPLDGGGGGAACAAADAAAAAAAARPAAGPAAPAPTPAWPSSALPFVAASNLLRWRLRPLASAGPDAALVPPPLRACDLDARLRQELPQLPQLVAALAQGHAARAGAVDVPRCVSRWAADRASAPSLLFLGTGAAVPSKYRNVSCILLTTGGGCALLDCGEGSLGQLERRLGAAGCAAALATLRLAWVSHIHADHHLGLLALLKARRGALLEAGAQLTPLPVVGPPPLRRCLEAHDALEPLCHVFLDAAETVAHRQAAHVVAAAAGGGGGFPTAWPPFAAALAQLRLRSLHSQPVVHCAHAYAAVVEGGPRGADGWKVVYSGDTRPCPQLATAARGATLLVHEATFEDALDAEAVAKRHSTTRDAVAAGTAAGAYRTLLTHFSQRYPKIPIISDAHGDSTAIAFDGLQLSLADLPHLPALLPALRALFPPDAADPDDDAQDNL